MNVFKQILSSIRPKESSTTPEILTKQRSRVDLQVSVLTALIVIVSCYLVFFLNYYFSYNSMISDLKDRALNIHNYLESRLDTETFYSLDEKDDRDTLLYKEAKELLAQIKEASGVRYLYTAKKIANGNFIYVVDGLDESSYDFRYIGDLIEPECIPDMTRALNGNTVLPEKINKTTWGPIFITYFPMHKGEEIIGVLGIEFDAQRQYESLQKMVILTPIVIIIFCLISAFIALKIFRRISNPSYRDIATTDFLTGIKNRNSFEIDISNLRSSPDRMHASLLSIDLDNLKQINDTYGHEAGDQYIKLSSRVARECISASDVIYRVGGDEFAVLLSHTSVAEIEQIRKEIQIKAAAKSEKLNLDYSLSISTGYAIFDPETDTSLFDTLKRADAMMYKEKRKKKTAVH